MPRQIPEYSEQELFGPSESWQFRLQKEIVIGANTRFRPDRVDFTVRTKLPVNRIDFLAEHKPSGAGPDFGWRHDQATGGPLTPSA